MFYIPVSEPIDLRKPLTHEDIDKLNKEADEAEEIVREYEQSQKDMEDLLTKAKKSAKGAEDAEQKAAQVLMRFERETFAGMSNPLAGMGGDVFYPEDEDSPAFGGTTPTTGQLKGRRYSRQTAKNPMANLARTVQRNKEAVAEAAKKHKVLAGKVAKVNKLVGEGVGFMTNPVGFGTAKLQGVLGGMVGKLGIAGGSIMLVVTIVQTLWKLFKKEFGPGGAFDIRKMMLDRDKTIAELDDILARRSGRVFFTGDVNLRQGAPEFSNTERLRDQALRYQALHLGE